MKQEKIYHVLWRDYDGRYHDRYTDEPDARGRAASVALREHNSTYGTELLNVFYGVDVEVTVKEPAEITIVFEEHKDD